MATNAEPLHVDVELVRSLLLMLAFLLATAAGVIALSVWRLNGDAPALYVGVAFLTWALISLGLARLGPLISPVAADPLRPEALYPAGRVVSLFLFFRCLTVPRVDARVRGWTLVAAASIAVALLWGLFGLVPALGEVIAGDRAAVLGDQAPTAMVSLLWLVLAVISVWRARSGRYPLYAWLSLMFLMLLASRLMVEAVGPGPTMQSLWWTVMRVVGLGFAWWGTAREMMRVYGEASSRVARSEYRASSAVERIRNEQAAQEERAHEARSALAAIEGATKTLEHYRDRLPQATQHTLMAGVVEEIRRLQRLVSLPTFVDSVEPFDVAGALMPLVELERARGTNVHVEIPQEATAVGRPGDAVQILQALLDNARRYARTGVLVDVMTSASGDELHIRVHDRGPGIPVDERQTIFQRGTRGSTSIATSGTGLGLAIASQLAEGQGGRLFVQERQGGGSVFVLALPAGQAVVAESRQDASNVV